MTISSMHQFARSGRHCLLVIPGLLLLTACGASLDTRKIATTIQDDVIKQGGLSLKEVICPDKIAPEAGKAFECVGVLDAGGVFAIPVKQQDAQGKVQWQIASVRGLLNVPDLQTAVQKDIQKEKDLRQATVDCGRTIYRPTKPGETFECKLLKRVKQGKTQSNQSGDKPSSELDPTVKAETVKATAKATTRPHQPETILITIDPTGNANWQRVFPGASPNGSTTKSSATPATSATAKPGVKSTPSKAQPEATTNNVPDPNRPSDSDVVVD